MIIPDEFVICYVDYSLHLELSSEYLRSIGWTLSQYKKSFPDAPLKARKSYKKTLSDNDIEYRRENMKSRVKDPVFQAKRKRAIIDYWASVRSKSERKKRSKRTQWQHENTNIEDMLRNHFNPEDK